MKWSLIEQQSLFATTQMYHAFNSRLYPHEPTNAPAFVFRNMAAQIYGDGTGMSYTTFLENREIDLYHDLLDLQEDHPVDHPVFNEIIIAFSLNMLPAGTGEKDIAKLLYDMQHSFPRHTVVSYHHRVITVLMLHWLATLDAQLHVAQQLVAHKNRQHTYCEGLSENLRRDKIATSLPWLYAILPTALYAALEHVDITLDAPWEWQAPLVASALIESLGDTDMLDALFDTIHQQIQAHSGALRL